MATWEFLLQQEGDRNWLPLESPVVEVLEGRYRLMAQSPSLNTTTWVEVTFGDEDAEPVFSQYNPNYIRQRRKVQSWESATNEDGLLLILPFSYLKPGQWDIRCQLIADDILQPQYYQLRVQVLATESNVKEPWSDSVLFTSPQTHGDPLAAITPQPIIAAGIIPGFPNTTEIQIPEFTFDLPPVTSPAIAGPLSLPQPSQFPGLFYLNIVQEHLACHCRGESVWLTGEIDVDLALDHSPIELPFPVELKVQLKDPISQTIVLELSHAIGSDLIPIPFACELRIPVDYQPHLVLGELRLYRVDGGADEDTPLAYQPFSIATNLDSLFPASQLLLSGYRVGDQEIQDINPDAMLTSPLAHLDDEGEPSVRDVDESLWLDAFTLTPEVEPQDAPVPGIWANLDLELFDLVKDPNILKPLVFIPHTEWVNPPRLGNHDLTSVYDLTPDSIQLPFIKPRSWHHSSPEPTEPQEECYVESEILLSPKRLKPSFSMTQNLQQLVQACQVNSTRESAPVASTGRAVKKQQFHAKLSELLQVSAYGGTADRQ